MIQVADLTPEANERLKNLMVTPVNAGHANSVKKVRFWSSAEIEPFSRHHSSNDVFIASPLGYMSYSSSDLIGARVGRFCSIAGNVKLMGDNHPTNWVTSHVFAYGPRYRQLLHEQGFTDWNSVSPVQLQKPELDIGNDVWIGRDAVLARGIKIGTGAIVAGSAVVTKDVPPYAIVGGVPAKVIRYRFPEDTIQRLLKTRWWEYSIASYGQTKFNDVEAFLDDFERFRETAKPVPPCRIAIADILSGVVELPERDTYM